MSEILLRHPQIREKRLCSSSAFYDEAVKYLSELEKDDVKQRIRTFSEDTLNDVLYALEILQSIEDAVIIVHGPRGCGSPAILDGAADKKAKWITTNLNQRDSIMGSDAKLRKAVLQAYKQHQPAVLFIVATPVVAINNDDIQSVVDELYEELGVPIIPVFTSGFKSKLGISGYDTVFHGIAKYLKRYVEKQTVKDFINVVSITENEEELKEITQLLEGLGIKSNYLPRLSGWKHFENAISARATITLNSEDGDFLGKVLEEQFDVPYLQTGIPLGYKSTEYWVRQLSEKLELLQQHEAREGQQLKALISQASLEGTKVYIHHKPSYAFELAQLFEDYGAEVVGISVTHIDDLHKEQVNLLKQKKAFLHVAGGQHFEIVNILKKTQPELYFGSDGQYSEIAKLGIVPIGLEKIGVLGYQGELNLLNAVIKAKKNASFVRQLHQSVEAYGYKEGWLEKRPSWYIKQEVK